MSSADRNIIQDIIWPAGPDIPKRYRREIAKALDIDDLFVDASKFDQLLASLFDMLQGYDDLNVFLGESDESLEAQIQRHVHRDPGGWSVEKLFNELDAFEVTDARFRKFLEGLASPDVMPDVQAQRRFVNLVNPSLAKCGLEMSEIGVKDGYPLFTLVTKQAAHGSRPKNLIFASSVKPDLRFRDAVNNDVEIVTNVDKVLVYDEPISSDGIRWCDLQAWWKKLHSVDDDDTAKKQLYTRLRHALPKGSPPQRLFFEAYHEKFSDHIPRLPALLPEVWLHWDPYTVKQRGKDALIRSRMDFLMLMPGGVRVVMEIDGNQHYSTNGRADPSLYARMVAADRILKMDGYHVFRFGGAELQPGSGQTIVGDFFTALFRRFDVDIATL